MQILFPSTLLFSKFLFYTHFRDEKTQTQKKLPNVYLAEDLSLVELEAESRHTDSQSS